MSITRDLFAPQPQADVPDPPPAELWPRQYATKVLEAGEENQAAVLETVPPRLRKWVMHYVTLWRPRWDQGVRPITEEEGP